MNLIATLRIAPFMVPLTHAPGLFMRPHGRSLDGSTTLCFPAGPVVVVDSLMTARANDFRTAGRQA